MKKEETAIVLIEYQNEFCSEEGGLYSAVKSVLEKNKTLENTKTVLTEARERGVPVTHVPIWFTPDYREVASEQKGVLKNIVGGRLFRKGTKGAEFWPELKPKNDEIVIEGKRTLSAFLSTNLNYVLRSKGIKNLVLCGFLTNICVESTARDAYDLGYNVYILKDCTAATSMEEQKFAEEKIFPALGEVLTHQELLKRLSA